MRFLRALLAVSFILFLSSTLGTGTSVLAAPSADSPQKSSKDSQTVEQTSIPGPLRSFLRMAAISQQVTPEEVLPLLARNIVVSGYQNGKPTQYLILVNWYMDQARELQALAGAKGVIHVANCDDAKPLL